MGIDRIWHTSNISNIDVEKQAAQIYVDEQRRHRVSERARERDSERAGQRNGYSYNIVIAEYLTICLLYSTMSVQTEHANLSLIYCRRYFIAFQSYCVSTVSIQCVFPLIINNIFIFIYFFFAFLEFHD